MQDKLLKLKTTNMLMLKLAILLLWLPLAATGQDAFSQEEMNAIYEEVKTPYKYGMVVAPTDNYHKIDCPTVFREGEKWYMTYVVYNGKDGLDGRGYETWLAESDDLLHWTTLGRLLSYKESGWDMNQRGGFPALIDWTWDGTYEMQPYKGRHWVTYIGGEGTGYEAVRAPLNIGMAWTTGDITTAHEWESSDKPLLSINDRDAQWWEKLVQYKSTIYVDREKRLGKRFVMFYNAGGINPANDLKAERIGIALSNDLKHWKRLPLSTDNQAGNPVFSTEVGGIITGDAQIVKMGDRYVMFYFSAYNPSRRYNAFNTFAVSDDLLHWQRWDGNDLIFPTKDYDEMFAHKSYVVKHDGVVYHFYCAVNNAGQRGIAVATSVPMGRSAVSFPEPERKGRRIETDLNKGWLCYTDDATAPEHVDLPHNADDYYGYIQTRHGNLHGNRLYTRDFTATKNTQRRYFLQFEGIGTYATVTLNGHQYERTPVGRTTYTLDITDALHDGQNHLEVLAEHPALITDMPWVCGGCSSEWGFSEGSQPLGIFRPVTLIETADVRIEPFGVHIWNNAACDSVMIDTEVHNYSDEVRQVEVVSKLNMASGKAVFRLPVKISLQPGETKTIRQKEAIQEAHRWNLDDPYLYSLASMVKNADGTTIDEISTPYGIRSISWPVHRGDGDGRFFLNGQPVFINGTCEYEHLFGGSHAFSAEQIASRVKMIRQAGFNAFREAHQPHNLRYQQHFDRDGMLFWSQFSAHIWYDTPQFRDNFKRLLRQWIRERRNSPSIILWGLQNESVLPKEFAEECTAIIREMDPTAIDQRAVTTCNGGEGTDWNVVQNWSGTYGGNPDNYGQELSRPDQLLNGEYGAWRTAGLHSPSEGYTEEKFCDLLVKKATLAEEACDSVCGHFQWLFVSHENPGRTQPDEALRRIDKVGPINYKGLLTLWEQPTDAYYVYRSLHVGGDIDPMVYMTAAGRVYSNCDSVTLSRTDHGIHAMGWYDGKVVAEDALGDVQTLIPTAADRNLDIMKPYENLHYVARINCGGDAYTDSYGNMWMQDNPAFGQSWGTKMGLDAVQLSQGTTPVAIHGTADPTLFRTFRFGRHLLDYRFHLPPGKYVVELYFAEPWIGRGGGVKTDCEGERVFTVEVNGERMSDIDLWAESGYAGACKKTVTASVGEDGLLRIHFPEVKAGQAVISAIAIATDQELAPITTENLSLQPLKILPNNYWANLDRDIVAVLPKDSLPDQHALPSTTYPQTRPGNWTITTGIGKEYGLRFRYQNTTGSTVKARLTVTDTKGIILVDRDLLLPTTPPKFKNVSTTTGTQINAGTYQVRITGAKGVVFEDLTVE